MASVTEASLRVATCSGALKLGKIKASTVDVDTAGESEALLATLSAHTLRPGVPDACKMQVCLIVGLCLLGGGGEAVGSAARSAWASPCRCVAVAGPFLVSAKLSTGTSFEIALLCFATRVSPTV